MYFLRTRHKLKVTVMILGLAASAYASRMGPSAGYTNAPRDIGNCTVCHDTFENPNVGPGRLTITAPEDYQPGQSYTIRVTIQQNVPRFGFQLTAIDNQGNRAGTLEPLDSETKVHPDTGFGGRQYIEHTEAGTSILELGRRIWQFKWTAPSTDAGTVSFFAAGNAANDNGNNQGDFIYTTSVLSESPTTAINLDLASSPDGQVFRPGDHFIINWTATNTSNVASFEARYSTDDGATFPITNLIFSFTDSSLTSFDWTIPNNPTTEGRIRLQAATQSGAAINVISGRFSISDDDGPPLPIIHSASVSGKKLFVAGENFSSAPRLLLNDKKQKKVFNDESNPSTLLVAKKSGKQISPGQTVILQVRNSDGSLSAPFSFTRPL
jgi:hypothetical protein